MISKQARRQYLQSKGLENYSWLKNVKRKDITNQVRKLVGYKFRFKTRPYLHQLVCFYLLVHENFLLFLDMGLGKTKIILDVISYLIFSEGIGRTLVVVPEDINIEGWEEEVGIHSHLTYESIPSGTSSELKRDLLYNSQTDLVFITYAGLMYLICDLVKQRNGKKKQKINKVRLQEVADLFDAIGLDEIQAVKNKDTTFFSVCDMLCHRIHIRFGATGTPFGRDPIDLWSQFKLIDRGETLGIYSLFREMFFVKKKGWGGHPIYEFDQKLESNLYKRMQNRSIRYEDNECGDLPKCIEQTIKVPFSLEVFSYYKPVRDALVQQQIAKDVPALENSYIRLRMLCSGFIQWKDEENKKTVVRFNDLPKVKALIELINEMPSHARMIVFHEYQETGQILEDALTAQKIKYVAVRGGKKDKVGLIRKFKDPKSDIKILVANFKAGVGGNYQKVANYLVFFEPPKSPIARKQCIKRVHRGGQKEDRVFIYNIVVKASVEVKMVQYLQEGEDLFQALVNGKFNVSDLRTPLKELV